ncbi:MAG: DUF1217 domain-containing protein [Paracoccaceae bacterium]
MFSPIVVGTGLSAYRILSETQTQQKATLSQSPAMERNVSAFKDGLSDIKTSDDLLDNRTMLTVALGAFGLDDDINSRAFLKQVLDSDLSDETSLANRLTDKRYQSLAEAFGFNSPNGPQLSSVQLGDGLDDVSSPEDLISDRQLLRTALARFGLDDDINNQFFLQRVLESDTSDPDSFVNQLGQSKYVAFADAFDFRSRSNNLSPTDAFVQDFSGQFEDLETAQDLLDNAKLLKSAVAVFDLPNDNPVLLRQVLTADPTDDTSILNQLSDKRYQAFSEAFGFGYPNVNSIEDPEVLIENSRLRADALDQFNLSDPGDDELRLALNSDLDDPASFVNQPDNGKYLEFVAAFQNTWPERTSAAEAFVTAIAAEKDSIGSAGGLVFNRDAFDATLDMFGLQGREVDFGFMEKVLDSDLSSDGSIAAMHPDKRLQAVANAFAYNSGDTGVGFPDDFASAITQRYVDRQFEIGVGDVDTNMRLALSLERELSTVVDRGGSIDAKWFNLMGSGPLRNVFETVLQLPSSIGSLDIDQQLGEFKKRAQATFGTTDLADLTEQDRLDDIRRDFLVLSNLNTGASTSSNSIAALTILTGR